MKTPREQLLGTGNAVSLGPSLARSKRFDALFAEGMALVEEAASYLDGAGRIEAGSLHAGLKGAYAAESMRLTTRLMQIASWLLMRRAIVDGEVIPDRIGYERGRLSLTAQHLVSTAAVFAQLPEDLQRLADRSLRLQARVLHLDRMMNTIPHPAAPASGLERQFALLHSAFAPAPR